MLRSIDPPFAEMKYDNNIVWQLRPLVVLTAGGSCFIDQAPTVQQEVNQANDNRQAAQEMVDKERQTTYCWRDGIKGSQLYKGVEGRPSSSSSFSSLDRLFRLRVTNNFR